jgi:hypothetical protein
LPEPTRIIYLFPLLLVMVVLRLRRDLGFQRVGSARVRIRMVMLFILAALVTGILVIQSPLLTILSLAASLSLVAFSVRTTVLEHRDDGIWFKPNQWVGTGLMVVYLGRIGFRFYQLWQSGALENIQVANATEIFVSSPLSRAALLLLVSYFAIYYLVISFRAKAEEL